MTDRWLAREDLTTFARSIGEGVIANGLWRLIETYLSWEVKAENYPGLQLRRAGTDIPWDGDHTYESEVSLWSLFMAREQVYERMVMGYGPVYHGLFCRWVDSLLEQ